MIWASANPIGAPVSARLDPCTRLIASGRYAGRDLAGIMLNRGNAYYNGQDYPRAIADYDEAIRLDPRASAAFSKRGNAYYAKGDLPHALADLNQAIALDMNNADAILSRGTVRLEAGDPDRAIVDFNAALLFKPTSAVCAAYAAAFRNRGAAFAEKGDQDHAIADFNQAIRLNPEDADAFSGRAAAYEAKGDLVRAAAMRRCISNSASPTPCRIKTSGGLGAGRGADHRTSGVDVPAVQGSSLGLQRPRRLDGGRKDVLLHDAFEGRASCCNARFVDPLNLKRGAPNDPQ
jgi:tetratricopeptide (TPR) repeat protein